jgi:hypothetical protein
MKKIIIEALEKANKDYKLKLSSYIIPAVACYVLERLKKLTIDDLYWIFRDGLAKEEEID